MKPTNMNETTTDMRELTGDEMADIQGGKVAFPPFSVPKTTDQSTPTFFQNVR